eukprot:11102397-Lingulodinium_polyedra.AAC.1
MAPADRCDERARARPRRSPKSRPTNRPIAAEATMNPQQAPVLASRTWRTTAPRSGHADCTTAGAGPRATSSA